MRLCGGLLQVFGYFKYLWLYSVANEGIEGMWYKEQVNGIRFEGFEVCVELLRIGIIVLLVLYGA